MTDWLTSILFFHHADLDLTVSSSVFVSLPYIDPLWKRHGRGKKIERAALRASISPLLLPFSFWIIAIIQLHHNRKKATRCRFSFFTQWKKLKKKRAETRFAKEFHLGFHNKMSLRFSWSSTRVPVLPSFEYHFLVGNVNVATGDSFRVVVSSWISSTDPGNERVLVQHLVFLFFLLLMDCPSSSPFSGKQILHVPVPLKWSQKGRRELVTDVRVRDCHSIADARLR